MSLWLDAIVLLLCLLASFAYSGSETAFYSVSRVRIDLEARHGGRAARVARWLLVDDVALLIVILIGNTLAVELMTFGVEDLSQHLGLSSIAIELVLAFVLTPFVFFFCEVLPKELSRRRPHVLLSITATFVALSRLVFFPLERLLRGVTWILTRLLRLEPRLLSMVRGREAVLRLLSESRRSGAIIPHAETLARNVLRLRSIEVERAMVPWKNVVRLSRQLSNADLYAAVARSAFTRLPVVDPEGQALGYVHQLDVLGAGDGLPVLDHVRPLLELAPHTPVDRAIARLRHSGQRLALIGSRHRPQGLVTLKDLVEEISGDLAAW